MPGETGFKVTDGHRRLKKGILPPYRAAITPLNSSTLSIFHSMKPNLLCRESIIQAAGIVNEELSGESGKAHICRAWPEARRQFRRPFCTAEGSGRFLRYGNPSVQAFPALPRHR